MSTHPPQHSPRRGFTLIELLVVMSVIAILMTFLVPVLGRVRRQVQENRTLAVITAVSTSCNTYYLNYNTYPPDRVPAEIMPPGLDKSSEAIVFFLSGSSICWTTTTVKDGYPWKNNIYKDDTANGTGRRALTPILQFKMANLADKDGDKAPELVDSWGMHFVYNSGGESNYNSSPPNLWNQLGAPLHTKNKFDLFSPGYDGKYGPYPYPNGVCDDLTSWGDEAPPPVDYDYSSMNATEP